MFGVYGCITGKLPFMPGANDSAKPAYPLKKGRAISAGLLVSAVLIFAGNIFGSILLVVLLLIPLK